VYVLSEQGMANQALEEEQDAEEELCEACGCNQRDDADADAEGDDALLDLMLECERCTRGWHPFCLHPPMTQLPPLDEDWLCADCAAAPSFPLPPAPAARRTRTASERFLLGDYFLARVERIQRRGVPPSATHTLRVRWFQRPEDTEQGRQSHQSRRLVFLSDGRDAIDPDALVPEAKPEVLGLDDFRARTTGDDVFLMTHRYSAATGVYRAARPDGAADDTSEDEEEAAERRGGGHGSGSDEEPEWRAAAGEEEDAFASDDDDDGLGGSSSDEEFRAGGGRSRGGPGKGSRARARRAAAGGYCAVGDAAAPGGAAALDDNRAGVLFAQDAVTKPRGAQQDAPSPAPGGGATPGPAGIGSAADALAAARAGLRLSAIPKSMPGRDDERRKIGTFVTDSLRAGADVSGRTMYISGMPGTGKTATVKEVMRGLRASARAHQLPPFYYVEVNGLRLQTPAHAYSAILEALTGERTGPARALEILDERFRGVPPAPRTTVLFIDEMDLLRTHGSEQRVLYNLFDWPTRRGARLVVLGVANTLHLADKLPPRIASRMGLTRCAFQPYNFDQLRAVVLSRLGGAGAAPAQLFEEGALNLATRKVAAVSGDARRVLELCRRSAELAAVRHRDAAAAAAAQGAEVPPLRVVTNDVRDAVREMFNSPHMQFITTAARHERILLAALLYETRHNGTQFAQLEAVAETHAKMCRANDVSVPPFGVLLAIACRLSACRLLVCEAGRRRAALRMEFSCPQIEVGQALEEDKELPWLIKYIGQPDASAQPPPPPPPAPAPAPAEAAPAEAAPAAAAAV
jgi:origin recognition complex subunit 1